MIRVKLVSLIMMNISVSFNCVTN